MFELPLLTWVGNAAAVLFGSHGDVAAQAERAGCSRQTVYDHAEKVRHAVEQAHAPDHGPSRDDLLRQVQLLTTRVEQLEAERAGLIRFDPPRQHRLAAKASAMGLSANQVCDILDDVLTDQPPDAPKAPSRAAVARWLHAAGTRAGAILDCLDRHSRPAAVQLCPDEIFFHGQPVLTAVEPTSMALLLCRRSADRKAATWLKALGPFARMEHAVGDAGTGLQGALRTLALARAQKRDAPGPSIGLDVFHTETEARKRLARPWRRIEGSWEAAEEADERVLRAREKNRDLRGPIAAAAAAWRRVGWAWPGYELRAVAWERAKAALQVFRPDGRSNDRAWAEGEIRAACHGLPGKEWKKVRSLLEDKRALASPGRIHRLLADVAPDEGVRQAFVESWRLENRGSGPGAV